MAAMVSWVITISVYETRPRARSAEKPGERPVETHWKKAGSGRHFAERGKHGCFPRSLHGRIHGGPQNACQIRPSCMRER